MRRRSRGQVFADGQFAEPGAPSAPAPRVRRSHRFPGIADDAHEGGQPRTGAEQVQMFAGRRFMHLPAEIPTALRMTAANLLPSMLQREVRGPFGDL